MLILLLRSLVVLCSKPRVTGRVTGTIVEARTGAPLAAVLVKVQSTGQQAFSDADGKFEIANVPVGPQTLLVSVVGYGLVRRDVTVSADESSTSRFPWPEGASTYVEDVAVGASRFREAEPGVASQSVLGSRELLALARPRRRRSVSRRAGAAGRHAPATISAPSSPFADSDRGNIGISIDGVDSPLLFHTVRGVQDTGSLGLINSDILESATLLVGSASAAAQLAPWIAASTSRPATARANG